VVSKQPHPTPKNLGWFLKPSHHTPKKFGVVTKPPHPKKIEMVSKPPHLKGGVVWVIYNPDFNPKIDLDFVF